jgi:soluble cytochrome b562
MKTMIHRSCLVVLSFALLAPLTAFAQKPESPVHDEMGAINHSFRQITRQYTDPTKKADTLDLVAQMQKHAETARTLTPPKADTLSGDDKTKYIDTFHKDLDALIKEIGALKQAITDDKADVVKAEIDKIAQLKNSSHRELGVGEGGHHGPPPGAPPGPPPGQ